MIDNRHALMDLRDGRGHDTTAQALAPLSISRADLGAPVSEANVFHVVHRLLRGRYALTLGLAAAGALVGAILGYVVPTPKFRSEGQIRVRPLLLNPYTGQQEVLPMFNGFMSTQANYAQSDRVLFRAMDSDAWRALGRARTPDEERRFKASLKVTTNPMIQELIFVSFTDLDPRAAKAGVEQVIQAFDDLYGRGESQARDLAITTNEEKRRKLNADLQAVQANIDQLVTEGKFGSVGGLEAMLTMAQQDLMKRTSDINSARWQIVILEQGKRNTPRAEGELSTSIEQIARIDARMAQLIAWRDVAQHQLESFRQEGLGGQHPTIRSAQAEVASWDAQIREYAERFVPPSGDGASVVGMANPEILKATLPKLQALVEESQTLIGGLSAKRSQIAALEARQGTIKQMINENEVRLGQLYDEKKAAQTLGQIETIMPLSEPSAPNVDPRKKLAAVGLVLGGGLPVACMALVGLMDRRYRFADQARDDRPQVALLGILPFLPRDLNDPEQSAQAAHSVHQMRTLLQIGSDGRKVYAVTSSTAGDGKTSLTMSLGMSFAASGARTLLIDFDMVGRGLSKSLGATPESGLSEVLVSGELNGSVVSTPIERLSLLPSGRDDGRFVSRLSEPMVRNIIEQARREYDVVLVDTGPILGSLEANFVSAAAEGVVLVVGRGQQRSFVDRALEQLAAIGAPVLGLVFNRATVADYNRSAGSASFRTIPADAPLLRAPVADVDGVEGLDPISRTVAQDVKNS